jgi:predicted porin
MKKLLIALAAVAAFGAAQAQVSIYGLVNATVDNTKTGTAAAVNSLVNDLSRIGFAVKEDLGSGLGVRAVIETSIKSQDPTTANTTQFGDRQATVGVANKVGSIDLGRNVHSQFLAITNNDVFGTLYGSVAGDVHNLRGLRMSNGVFASVAPVAGVNASVDRTYTATGNEAISYGAGASVAGINVTAARYNDGGVETSNVIGANTTLGNTTIAYTTSNNKSATVGETKKGNLIGVAQKFGVITAKASYGRTNTSLDAYNVGAEYALSKRTAVLVSYRNVNATGTASDIKQAGVGLTHAF